MDFITPLLAWYECNARDLPWRRTNDAYAVWVSEIMLQQTRVTAVIPYYERFMAALPDVRALSRVDDERLHKLWEGLGYYSRARNLKRAAGVVVSAHGGVLPTDYETLLTLPGIGDYTAGAVASIAGNEPVPAVDGNVLRVWARLTDDASDVAQARTKACFRQALLPLVPKDAPGRFNAALMELGATVCVPNGVPDCGACPVSAFCKARLAGRETALPVRQPKRARRIEEKTVFALRRDGAWIGYRRPDTGLLAGLWQLPDAPGAMDELQMVRALSAWGARPVGELLVYERRHVFTHVEWRMRVCRAEVDLPVLPDGWAALDETKALPAAYRVCL